MPSIIERRPSEIVGFLGARGTGKTSLMREVIRANAANDRRLRFIVYDFGGQFVSGRMSRDNQYVPDPGTFSNVVVYRTIEEARKTIESDLEKFQILVFPATRESNQSTAVIDFACEIAGCCLVLDEVDQYVSKHQIPRNIEDILNIGRHIESANWIMRKQRGVSLFWSARRIAKVHNDFVSASAESVLYLTRTIAETDVSRISSEVDHPIASEVRALRNGEFLRLDQGYPTKEPNPLIIRGLTPYQWREKYEQGSYPDRPE